MKKLIPLVVVLAGSATAQVAVGNWYVVSRIDKMTDANTSYAVTSGLEDEDAALVMKCMDDGLNIYFDPDDYLGSERNDMYWRFDKNQLYGPFKYDTGTEGTLAFLPMNLVQRFIANAKAANQVTLRAMDYNKTPHTVTFNLKGISEAITRLNCR